MGFWRRIAGIPEPSNDNQPDGEKAVLASPELIKTIQGLTDGYWPGAYGAMYRRQPAVRASVDWLGRNIAQLNPKVYERVSDADRLEVGDHPLATLLRRPNPLSTRYRLIRDTVSDVAIYDRAVWVKSRNRGRLVAVTRVPSNQIQSKVVEGRRVFTGPDGTNYGRSDLVIFHGYSPDGDDNGVSPMETLRRVLAEEHLAQQHRENMWRNSARQSGFLERPLEAPRWSADARTRFRQDFESVMTGGDNAGRVGILEEGMKWNGNSFSPKDTEYLEGRRLTYEEVCIAYGLKPSLLGMGDDTASSSETNHRHAYQDVLGPWLRMLQDEIELQVLPEFEPFSTPGSVYVEFNLGEKLKGSFEEQSKSITTSVGVPYMSVNEGRARLNLPKIPAAWADAPVQPLNVMYGGQAAVTVPTEVPGDPQPVKSKAAPRAALSRQQKAARAHRDLLAKFFARQETAVVSAFGGKSKDVARDRWIKELGTDLFALAWATTTDNGKRAAAQLGGVYDEDRTRSYLAENAKRTAEQVNAHTFEAIDDAEDLDAVKAVFETAKSSRAEMLGLSLATVLINFARTEAGKHTAEEQGRSVMKTWVVTNPRSRHPEMNGQSVPVDGTFSNGARWPGDPSLGADGAAGCGCLLEIGD